MARKPATVLTPVTTEKPHPDDTWKELEALKKKVDFLWRMTEFLNENPRYKVGDYLQEHHVEVARLNQGSE